MKKRYLISALAMMLTVMLLGLSCGALADGGKVGTLSYLNMTEEEDSLTMAERRPMVTVLFLHGVFTGEDEGIKGETPTARHYDSLNAMLMGLQSGEVDKIKVPYYTAKYLCSTNDGLRMTIEYHPEMVTGYYSKVIDELSDGYSFMMKEENTALRDEFDAQITAMKEDGTLNKLVDEFIYKVSEGGEPVPVAFEKFEGDPIRIAVTGSLPPMDYVAADGSFAGFNTAVLAEIGQRMHKNIELVQVDSIGRALALSEGVVDVVFWTRSVSENMTKRYRGYKYSQEELEAQEVKDRETLTDEEQTVINEMKIPDQKARERYDARDMPAGTIITQPYFSDFAVRVVLK